MEATVVLQVLSLVVQIMQLLVAYNALTSK